MIRVIIADDSATARNLLTSILHSDPGIRVVGEAADGRAAIRAVMEHKPDLVLMDVHMPICDGLDATKEIMARCPTPIIIVSAVATRDDVDLSLSATQAGALLALPKPESALSPRFPELCAELVSMVKAMAQVRVVRRWAAPLVTGVPDDPAGPPAQRPIRAVAVAASTGGPPALRRMLMDLPSSFPAPFLVVQHIARDFTAGFAEWLGRSCALPVKLAAQGESLCDGTVYVAPDDRHLGVSRNRSIELSMAPPIGGFRPSATHLFVTAGAVFGPRLAALVLTGMGSDGVDGLVSARAAGARVLIQDRASSVVYGMAESAEHRGLVDEKLPLDRIPARLLELASARLADEEVGP